MEICVGGVHVTLTKNLEKGLEAWNNIRPCDGCCQEITAVPDSVAEKIQQFKDILHYEYPPPHFN
jgi:hypothetical protein